MQGDVWNDIKYMKMGEGDPFLDFLTYLPEKTSK